MRIALVERFGDASRRCEPGRIAAAGDDVVSWDLVARDEPFVAGWLRRVPRALRGLARVLLAAPSPERARVLRACLTTGGARVAALAHADALLRDAASGRVDRVACFSARDFAFAELLAERAGVPLERQIDRGTKYFGEFAFELLAVVPYAYWLHRQGRLEYTISTPDTRCLYYFSPDHEERAVARNYVPVTEWPTGEPGLLVRWDRKAFPWRLDTARWSPPPYRDVYRDDRFRFGRPTCVVCNKASDERYLWRGFAVNYIDNELLLEVIGKLRERYQVVYDRPRAADIVNDHQSIREIGDIEAIRSAYPDVLTIQDLHAHHPELGFNELQLRVFAGCERFVSVLGGSAYLASWFGGVNVVYARRGWEVTSGAYGRWFDRFSGARVVAAATPDELRAAVARELLG